MSRIDDELGQLGIEVDPQLLELALTHRSWAYENGQAPTNERLEFLGDSVLGLHVTEHIYRTFPDRPEGQLAKLRAAVVSGHSLAQVAARLEVGTLVKLGRGEIATHGDAKESILADTLEALIGAVHITGGIAASGLLVHHWFDAVIDRAAHLGAGLDWKSSLQELCAGHELGVPSYEATASGPDHHRWYEAFAVVADQRFGPGEGPNKRVAEQKAAALAYAALSDGA